MNIPNTVPVIGIDFGTGIAVLQNEMVGIIANQNGSRNG
jgi:hypothetical protein